MLGSYALSSNRGFNGVTNNDNWFESYGPRDMDRRHVFTFSGIADLPWGLRVSAVSKVLSGPPFRAQLFGLDLNGDGTINDLLPGRAGTSSVAAWTLLGCERWSSGSTPLLWAG